MFGLKTEIRRAGAMVLARLDYWGDRLMAGIQELETEIAAVRASEQALLAREAANAARLQSIIDTLQGQATAPELQPQIDELKAIQAEMDAAVPA